MKIVSLPELAVVGFLVEGRWNDLPRLVPAAWKRLFAADTRASTFLEVSISFEDGVYRELIGFLANGDAEVPAGMERHVFPARTYLQAIHDGPLVDIAQTFLALENEARRIGRHTDFKLDIGYKPELSAGRHELYVGLEAEAAVVG